MIQHEPEDTARRARRIFAVVLVVGLLVIFFRMVGSLLGGAIGGVIFWALSKDLFERILARVGGRRGLAAALSVGATVLLVVIPTILILTVVVADATNLAASIGEWIDPHRDEINQELRRFMRGESINILGYELRVEDVTQRVQAASGQIGTLLLALVSKTAGGVFNAALLLFVVLYTQFFFYIDGDRFLAWVARLLPLSESQCERLFHDFFATSRATLKTIGILGAVQGTMGGVAFWLIGIPAPFFWTVLMAFTSAIPSVGAQVILVPTSVLLIVFGKTFAGVALLVWSLVFIGSADNLLRPVLVSHDVEMHELLVFLSTLGGIATFGFFGVVIGPVIAALLKVSLEIYSEVYGRERELVTTSTVLPPPGGTPPAPPAQG
ncbi:MAG: AI-2E family transporter [Acidobacteria bacterium]|nr:AI-2E family transporter [Acidobacteriota bacterium]